MAKQPEPDGLSELRKRTEATLDGGDAALLDASPEEMARVVHELRTHQIELELQNAELRKAQAELVASRDRFVDLYEFAPVGYATVSGKGIIQQANLRLTEMLGVPRARLVGHPLSAFVAAEDADAFRSHQRAVSSSDTPTACELRMRGPDGTVFWAAMECVAEESAQQCDAVLRCSVSDITLRKQAEEALARRAEFERLISEISSDIAGLSVSGLDSGIDCALSRIGEFTEADRAYVFEFKDGGTVVDNTHEWCREGVVPQIQVLKDIPLHEDLPWFAKCITARETFRVPDVSALPPEARLEREHFEAQNIRSLIVVPMVLGSRLTGFLGFDSVRERRDWTEEETALLRLVSGTVAHALGRVADETALRASRKELAEIFAMSLDLICVADIKEATFLKVNPAFTRVLGYDEAELVGHPFSEFIHPDDIEPTRSVVEDELQQSKEVLHFTNRHRCKDGTWRWLEWTSHPLTERGVTFAVAHDVTERRRAQEELKRERDFAESLVETAQTIVLVLDTEGRTVRFNPYMEKLTGYRLDEVKGKDWFETFVPGNEKPRIREVFARAIRDIPTHGNVNAILTKDGQRRDIDWYDHVLKDAQGETVGVLAVGHDVTDRIQREEELRTKEYLLAKAQEIGRIGTWELDIVNDILIWTEENHRLFGVPVDTPLTYEVFLSCVHPDDRDYVAREWTARMKTNDYDIEHRLIVDGEVRWVREKAEVSFDDAGLPVKAIGFTQDITAIKQAEAQLMASREELAEIFNLSPDLVCVADINEATFLKVNPAFTEVLGYEEAELVNHPFSEFIHPDDIEPTRKVVEEELQQGKKVLDFTNRYRRKDGTWCWLEWAAHPLPDRGITFSVAHDITERKQAEATAREQDELLRQVMDGVQEGIILYDRDLRYRFWNRWMEDVTDVPASEILGRHPEEMFPFLRDVGLIDALERSLNEGRREATEYPFSLPGTGRSGWAVDESGPLRDAGGEVIGVIAIVRDITESKRLQERLRQTEKMEAIGQLAGGVAHDFNNQLAGIMNYADLLLSKTDDEELRPFIDGIIRLSTRSGELTNQLLAFARKGQYQIAPVNIHGTIGEVVGMLGRSGDKRITIRQLLEANPPTTTGDSTQLQNALLNLGLNARDAMPDGGELVFATDTVKLDEEHCGKSRFDIVPGDYLKITVTDSGTGMDAETLSRVFEPFFTTKEQGKGTGMGLASVYGTAVNHHGVIEVTSEVGKGTTVTLYLPLSRETVKREAAAASTAAGVPGSARILLVDDERSVRESTAALLRNRGYKVVTAEDGVKAVEYYEKSWQHIDLVILDMNMPVMNGRDTFVAMREMNPDIKAMLATGYSMDSNAQEILDEGALSHTQKPFRIDDVIVQIEAALKA